MLLVLTEWPEFLAADPETVGRMVRTRTIIDARNCLDAEAWRAAGWNVQGLGRASAPAERPSLVLA